jgi:L-cysteine S-thiosulfotransferase
MSYAHPLGAMAIALAAASASAQEVAAIKIEGNAILQPLTDARGDPKRGERIVADGNAGNCFLCHTVPDSAATAGDIGPPLAGIGGRAKEGELRLRLVDATKLNPDSVMPAYHRIEALNRVDSRYRGKPLLTAHQIEDVIAYLLTLK